jgi:hypothetical protein
MKLRQVGLGKLLAIIAVLAVDLAAGRAILAGSQHFGWDLGLLLVVAPIGLTLQAATFQVVSSRGRSRIFWVGFLTFGLVAMSSVLLAMYDPSSEKTIISSSGVTQESYPGGPMARLWGKYGELVYAGLENLKYPYTGVMTDWRSSSADAVVRFLPQLLMACAGGLLAWLMAGRWPSAPPEQFPEKRPTTRLIVAVMATSVIPLAAATWCTWQRTIEMEKSRELDQRLRLQPMIDDLKFLPDPSQPPAP